MTRAQFALLGFEMRWVNLKVCLAAPSKIAMMLNFMQSIALYTPRILEVASESGIIPLSAILALWNT